MQFLSEKTQRHFIEIAASKKANYAIKSIVNPFPLVDLAVESIERDLDILREDDALDLVSFYQSVVYKTFSINETAVPDKIKHILR